jgi:DNA-binding response OmpR family regulator
MEAKMVSQPTILLIEDDPSTRETLEVTLARRGYRVITAPDGNAAKALVAGQNPDIAVLNMLLPGQSGFQIAQFLKEHSAGRIVVVMISGYTSAAHRDYEFAAGVDRFLGNSLAIADLVGEVESLCPPPPTATINGHGMSSRSVAMSA